MFFLFRKLILRFPLFIKQLLRITYSVPKKRSHTFSKPKSCWNNLIFNNKIFGEMACSFLEVWFTLFKQISSLLITKKGLLNCSLISDVACFNFFHVLKVLRLLRKPFSYCTDLPRKQALSKLLPTFCQCCEKKLRMLCNCQITQIEVVFGINCIKYELQPIKI